MIIRNAKESARRDARIRELIAKGMDYSSAYHKMNNEKPDDEEETD
jgi:hypothetical protein